MQNMGRFLKFVIALMLFVMAISGTVSAQEKMPLAFGEWVSGEITNDHYETKYTFSGKKDQLVTADMVADPDANSLDAFLVLRTSDGDILGQNDNVLNGGSLVVARLPADGDYTVLATRYNGKDGDTEGKYWIRLDEVQPLTVGMKTTVSFTTDDEKRFPTFYVLTPENNESLKFGFNEASASRYPQIGLFKWVDNNYPEILMWAEYTSNVSNLAFSANLEADTFYVLMLDPVPVFYGNQDTATLAFSIN